MAFKFKPENINYRRAFKPKQRQNIDINAELKKLVQKELQTSLKKMVKEMDLFGDKKSEKYGPFLPNDKEHSSKSERMNEKQAQMNIDQLVADALMNGKFTTGILKSLFGLVPNLIGR